MTIVAGDRYQGANSSGAGNQCHGEARNHAMVDGWTLLNREEILLGAGKLVNAEPARLISQGIGAAGAKPVNNCFQPATSSLSIDGLR